MTEAGIFVRSIELQEAADRWAELALESGWTDQWVEGAIFPCEMVYFLARSETEGITTIIESGRQDGYSTVILGEFARRTGIRVISIDYEEEAERGRRCRERLAEYPVEALVGDAFELFGQLLARKELGRVALLVDGPKGWSANALVLASAPTPNVHLIGLHNQIVELEYTQYLFNRFTPVAFHENFLTASEGAWAKLRDREARLHGVAARSIEQSSLAIFVVPKELRTQARRIIDWRFMLFQPPFVDLVWRAGWYRFARQLHSLSFRIFYSRVWRLVRR